MVVTDWALRPSHARPAPELGSGARVEHSVSPYAAGRFSRRWSFLGLLSGGDCEPGGTFVYRSHAKYATHDNPPLIAANDSAARPQSFISCLPFSVRSRTGLKNELPTEAS